MNKEHACPVCSGSTLLLGGQKGRLDGREFLIRHCPSCQFSFVENYRSDFENVYNESYYRGLGADPKVDYVYELEHTSQTIRNYEWRGILSIYKKFSPNGGRWLDYGCGIGGMVRFAIDHGIEATGYEEGWAAEKGRSSGVPMLRFNELENYAGKFDFITAIEVLEHIPKPMDALLQIRRLLKPGGVFFLTTGNAEPWRKKLLAWDYTKCPDVHVSFFEPETLSRCMKAAGLSPHRLVFVEGFADIIKFKVLKTLGVKDQSRFIDLLPWRVISRIVDAYYKVSRQPYAIAEPGG